ncbi:MAG: methyltransferase domain-containing protein [Planctomycetia bacterium]|nr:methyltransferase domain-containing protein [Planctomycetia bacterium]
MKNKLKDYVIKIYSLKNTQEWYIKSIEKGLWGSEEVMIKKYFKTKSTTLDIGCGTGRTTIHLNKLGYNVKGMDITPDMIKNAKKIARLKHLKIIYEEGDVTNLKYRNSSFDNALFSYCGWNQIPGEVNRLNALKEIYRVLKSGGHLILTSHIRNVQGFSIFWIKQWVKIYIQKPLGFNISEVEFGDYFYKSESICEQNIQKQYVHMPRLKLVKEQIAKVGFDLVFNARADTISSKNAGNISPIFFICKKPINEIPT